MERFRNSLLLIILGAGAVILFASVPAGAIPVVSVQPALSTPSLGTALDVLVEISAVNDCANYQIMR